MVKPGSQGQGLQGYSFQHTSGRHLSLQEKRKKKEKNPICRDRCAQALFSQRTDEVLVMSQKVSVSIAGLGKTNELTDVNYIGMHGTLLSRCG